MTEIKSHIFLSVGCPLGDNSDFTVEGNKFICNFCKNDFTLEVKSIYEALKEQFKQKKKK